MFNDYFCPFMSSQTQKVKCDSKCMLYMESETSKFDGMTCSLVRNTQNLDNIAKNTSKIYLFK